MDPAGVDLQVLDDRRVPDGRQVLDDRRVPDGRLVPDGRRVPDGRLVPDLFGPASVILVASPQGLIYWGWGLRLTNNTTPFMD